MERSLSRGRRYGGGVKLEARKQGSKETKKDSCAPALSCLDLGLINYEKASRLQEELRERRLGGDISNTVLLLEHPPVFTLGRRACEADIISPRELIARDGIKIIKTNRGGLVTYHGPGQLVGYFICSIREMIKTSQIPPLCKGREGGVDNNLPPLTPPYKGGVYGSIERFVWLIEEVLLRLLSDFNITGERDADHPGIWINRKKIAAIGLHVTRGITQHGFSFNVDCDLSHYRHIVPCGITGRGITSLKVLLGKAPLMAEIKQRVVTHLERVFGPALKRQSANGSMSLYDEDVGSAGLKVRLPSDCTDSSDDEGSSKTST